MADFAKFVGGISTNTLLAEGDGKVVSAAETIVEISTNTLLAEGDGLKASTTMQAFAFQPTPSSRRVTVAVYTDILHGERFQPTPSSRRVTGTQCTAHSFGRDFNQHPPRGG